MLTHVKKVCNPFWGSAISRKSIDIYRYALTGWGEELGTIGVIWPCVNGIVYAMSVRKGGWNLENGVSSTSLRNPWARHLQEAGKLAEEIGLPGELWLIQAALGELSLLRDDQEQAHRAFKQAATIVRKLAENIGDDEMKANFLASPLVRGVLEQNDLVG